MFLAILSTIGGAFSDIFRKKSLGYNVGGKIHDLLSYPFGLLVVFYFIYIGLEVESIDHILLLGTSIILIIGVFNTAIGQKIYREEKISTIIPYTNVNKILTIIASFFLFADVTLTSLLITVFAIFIIIIVSIDFKTLKFPKNISLILLSEIIRSSLTICTGWLIFQYNEILYFTIYVASGIIFLFILSYFLDQFKTIKGLPKGFWINRYIGGAGWISRFLSLVVIKDLGLSISILLSFLGLGVTLLFSYLLLNDKPSRKDLLLTIVVTLLVGLGYLYK